MGQAFALVLMFWMIAETLRLLFWTLFGVANGIVELVLLIGWGRHTLRIR